MEALLAGLGVLVGLLAGYVYARSVATKEKDALRERLATVERERDARTAELTAWKDAHASQRKTEEQAREDLKHLLAGVSTSALKDNREQFLALAGERFQPINELLTKLQKDTQQLEAKREQAYGAVEARLKQLYDSTRLLDASNQTLATALRGDARARGRWGEVTLRKIVEMAGMTNHVDFTTQETVGDGSRPDMIVKMPEGDLRIPVDSKVPMDAYMRAMECEDADVRKVEIAKHAADMLLHVKALAKRDYAEAVGGKVTFTVMFVPGEPILAAAFEARPSLQDEALDRKVLLATPVTLIALLYTVAVYWQQSALAENAGLIADVSKEFYKRVQTFVSHFAGVGKGLDTAVRTYNQAIGSYERAVLPQARRVEELDVPEHSQTKLTDIPEIGREPRALPPGVAADDADDAEAGAS